MANLRMTLLDLLNKEEQGADPSFLRDGVRPLAQELMDAEVTQLAGAGLHERSANRLTYRNGYREREWDTRVGTVDLHIPKLRQGAYFPSLLEPRRRHERALLSRESPRTRSAGSAKSSTVRSPPSAPAGSTPSTPT
jgi:transposase-like protein